MERERFPLDDATLVMLAESCRIHEDGKSHLFDFLNMGTDGEKGGPSPQEAIIAMAEEIQRLRSEGGSFMRRKMVALTEVALETVPYMHNIANDPSQSPWRRETAQGVLDRVRAAIDLQD